MCTSQSREGVLDNYIGAYTENETNQVLEPNTGNAVHAYEQKFMLKYVLQKASEIFWISESLLKWIRESSTEVYKEADQTPLDMKQFKCGWDLRPKKGSNTEEASLITTVKVSVSFLTKEKLLRNKNY